MEWNTRLTSLLGCQYPIMQGGLSGLGDWKFAAAVSKAGGMGCLTADVCKTPEKLRDDIRKLRSEVGHFMVNLSLGGPNPDELLPVCLEEKVPVIETAVYRPDRYAHLIKKAGITWVHKAATVNHLKHAEKLGVDAVVLVGLDGWGIKNIHQLPTFTAIAWGSRQLKVPLIAAGGIGDGRTFLAALAAGAEGVYMGTAFLITKECRLSERIKQNLILAQPDHPDLIHELVDRPSPKDYEEIMSLRDKMPFRKWIVAYEKVLLKRKWTGAKSVTEQEAANMLSHRTKPKGDYSFACAYLDHEVTCKELIEGIIREAEDILQKWANQFKLIEP